MQQKEPALALVVIAGPQASGKSTVAAALSVGLRERGERVAVVELDQIAAMALPTLPSWEIAAQITQAVAGRWLRTDLTCVIVEGFGSAREIAGLREQAAADAVVVTVATTTTVAIAVARAQADPTRGVSKDPAFLRRVYDRWPAALAAIAPDVVLDTGAVALPGAVDAVVSALATARQPTT